jgi:hypothetical protein
MKLNNKKNKVKTLNNNENCLTVLYNIKIKFYLFIINFNSQMKSKE